MNKRAKMPPSQRAKQFAPFDAVVGLRIALKEKEKIRVPRKIVCDDKAELINRTLLSLSPSDTVTVIYYNENEEEYIQLTGKIILIDKEKKIIKIGRYTINTDDIYDVF